MPQREVNVNDRPRDAKPARSGRAFLLMLMASLLAACSNGPPSTFEDLGRDANTRGFGREFPHDPNENAFVFGVGDEVVVSVDEEIPEFTGTYIIRQDGKITLKHLNEVVAAGLTVAQLRQKLETRLRLFLHEPQLTLSPGAIVSRNYFVASTNPTTGGALMQAIPYAGDVTLLDAFVQMGAPSTLLDDDCHVHVIRGDPRYPRKMTINVKQIYTEGYTAGNIQIQPDDIVFVPPSWLGRVNIIAAGISIPFTNLFRTVSTVDRFRLIVDGGQNGRFARGNVFF